MPAYRLNSHWAQLTLVIDGLYIGGAAAVNSKLLLEHGITCIVNATKEVPSLFVDGIESHKLWIEDTLEADIGQHFDTIVDLTECARSHDGAVLIHCLAGVSRSASLVLAYLVRYQDMSLRAAYNFLAAKRPMVRPNLSFWRQLLAYEQRIRGSQSVRIQRCRGQREGLPDVYLSSLAEEEEETFELEPEELESSLSSADEDCMSLESVVLSEPDSTPPNSSAPTAVKETSPPIPIPSSAAPDTSFISGFVALMLEQSGSAPSSNPDESLYCAEIAPY